MNVLSRGQVPNVLSLREVLSEWLDHRKDVLVRRSNFRLGKIAERLEVLGGYLIAYLNLDEVIRIIREEDEPKAVMMARFELTDMQVEAILNMRLRALRKLEEFEIRKEFDGADGGEGGPRGAARLRGAAVEVRRLRDRARCARRSGRTRRSASAAPASPMRPRSTSTTSSRR